MQKLTLPPHLAFLRKYATRVRMLDVGSGGRKDLDDIFPNRVKIDADPARKPDIVADAESLPFTDGEFEAILCSEMLPHTPDPHKAVREMHRVLARGGLLILTVRFVYPYTDPPHDYWRFSEHGLRLLLADGWDILEMVPQDRSFSSLAVLLQRVLYQTDLRGGRFTKGVLYLLLQTLLRLDWLIVREYGDIKRQTPLYSFMPTAYFVAAKKR